MARGRGTPTESMRDSPLPQRRRTGRAGRWLFGVALVGSAMALGGLHTTVLMVATLAFGAAALLVWIDSEPARPRPAATLVFWVALLLTLWTFVQCIPLPASLIAALNPRGADVWARCLTPLREPGPRWITLSLDPAATKVQVLRGVCYLLAFVGALRIARRREGVIFLERSVVLAGAALAVAAWLHPAVG